MARVPLDTVVRNAAGAAQPGQNVTVYERGTLNPVTGYTTETGPTTVVYPLVTDSEGKVDAWYPGGSYDIFVEGDALNNPTPWEATVGSPHESGELVASDEWESTIHGTSSQPVSVLEVTFPCTGGHVVEYGASDVKDSAVQAYFTLATGSTNLDLIQVLTTSENVSKTYVARTYTPGTDLSYKVTIGSFSGTGTVTVPTSTPAFRAYLRVRNT
jgi:hypothetical protein